MYRIEQLPINDKYNFINLLWIFLACNIQYQSVNYGSFEDRNSGEAETDKCTAQILLCSYISEGSHYSVLGRFWINFTLEIMWKIYKKVQSDENSLDSVRKAWTD